MPVHFEEACATALQLAGKQMGACREICVPINLWEFVCQVLKATELRLAGNAAAMHGELGKAIDLYTKAWLQSLSIPARYSFYHMLSGGHAWGAADGNRLLHQAVCGC